MCPIAIVWGECKGGSPSPFFMAVLGKGFPFIMMTMTMMVRLSQIWNIPQHPSASSLTQKRPFSTSGC